MLYFGQTVKGGIVMQTTFEKIGGYLQYLTEQHGVQLCIKDFCGFVAINKQLDEALRPFLAHTNPFCMYMKSNQTHYHTCLTMIRRMYHKCERVGHTYFGMCHAGLGEYVVPIFSGSLLLGSINAGFFQTQEHKTFRLICHTCQQAPPLDAEKAKMFYAQSIRAPTIDVDHMLAALELLAEYLGLTYHMLQSTHPHSDTVGRYHDSSEDTILAHALEYIRQNYRSRITVSELCVFCHCSESYLSRIFKRRTGVNINVYVNKVRMEFAKNPLCLSNVSIAEVAASVGFDDPNYFSRVFAQTIGISPTEFRKRFHRESVSSDSKKADASHAG